MVSRYVLPLLLGALLLPAAGVRADEDALPATPEEHLISKQADAVVSIRFVLKTRMTMMGNSQDRESSQEIRGTLVDAGGLVMTAASHFEGGLAGGIMRMLGQDIDIDTTPSDFKVLFGTEEEEFDARLVAKDSDLGVAFLQILDLQGKAVEALHLSDPVEPRIGEDLLSLTRMARSFDCAPTVGRLYVTAAVERPRPMWAVGGDAGNRGVGMPVFLRSGHLVGVLSMHQGAEDVGGGEDGPDLLGLASVAEEMGAFVIPTATLAPVVAAAKKRAAELALKEGTDEEGESR